MVKINLLKIINFLLKPVIILLVFLMYCFIVALTIMLLLITAGFSGRLNISDNDMIINIMEIYFPFFERLFEVLFSISFILYLIFVLYLFIKNGDYLYRYLTSLKIALIPFWIIATILMIPITLGGAFVGFFVVPVLGTFLLPMSFIIGFYSAFVLTSVSNILFLINLIKKKMIGKLIFALNLAMQLCLFLDIVSSIYLKTKYREIITD